MQNISLLNSIIGPVMRGPSSSHSAGPYQIANAIRQLALEEGGTLKSVRITFDPSGSFAQVYSNQGSDEGFAAGFVGESIIAQTYREALPSLKRGEHFRFDINIAPLIINDHPNRVEIKTEVQDDLGMRKSDIFQAISLGGGMFIIDMLNGHAIDVKGSEHVVLIEGDKHALSAVVECGAGNWSTPLIKSDSLLQFNFSTLPQTNELKELANQRGIKRIRYCAPSQFCVNSTAELLTSAAAFTDGEDIDLAAVALQLESKRLGLSLADTRKAFEERCQIMMTSVANGLSANIENDRMKYLSPTAGKIKRFTLPASIGGGFLQNAISAALAVMEENTNRGIVVAAPTAGSAGIVPGILYAMSQSGTSPEDLVDSLQVMALIGAVFAVKGSFAAETGGCSVETGASSAMATAGLVYTMGGNARQIFQAASLCIMNTLGLVCDPVGGEVEIPCHARNVAGVAHAQTSAIAILSGFDAVLPFDEMVQSTIEVGDKMHPDLRCTARGGCATTPTACCLKSAAEAV